MSLFTITIRNYRNIPHDSPIQIDIDNDISFFVGINNIGKTNLLRFFHEFRPIFNGIQSQNLYNGIDRLTVQLNVFSDKIRNQNSDDQPTVIDFHMDGASTVVTVSPKDGVNHTQQFYVGIKPNGLIKDSKKTEFADSIMSLFQKAIFIPTTRSIVQQSYVPIRDIVAGQDLVKEFDSWQNGQVVSQQKQIELLIEEMQHLFGFKRFNLTVSADKNALQVRTDDGYMRLDELGEGIGHFVIVLLNALFKKPNYIFIDEPEIGLHPRMQELFIRALASKAKFGLIAASHAIGLARSVADRIYSLARDSNQMIRLRPFGEHSKFTISQSISELGYSQFVEIGGNHLLLVEGRTDIKSFREILRKYDLDTKFIIWQLGGGGFIQSDTTKIADELNDIKRLNAKSYSIIFDSERTAKGLPLKSGFQTFKESCENLGFNVFATDYHSTENYIHQKAINAVVGTAFTALSPYEAFGTNKPKWDKNKNWLMFREMKKEDFAGTELDTFIQKTLVPAAAP